MSLYKMSLFKQCIVILAMAVMAGFAGCGDNNEPAPENQGEEQTENSTDLDTDEPDIIDGVTCSELGMIPNDNTKGASNRTILIDALKNGTNILVDDKYFLTGLGTATQIDQDIVIAGITDNAELSFTKTTLSGSSNFVRVASANLLMQKIRFTTNKDEALFAFRLSDAHKMKKMIFENCYFEGPIRLVSWQYLSGFPNPDMVDYGIETFKFNNNKCKNISKTLLELSNVAINHSQIINNEIRNFSHIFF